MDVSIRAIFFELMMNDDKKHQTNLPKYSAIFLITLICFNFNFSHAQTASNNFTISGKTVDEKSNAIPFASIALHAAADSTLIGGNVSDESGNFEIIAKPGKYFLKISFLSYEEKIISDIQLSKNYSVGTIVLRPNAKELREVTITGEKSQMEFQLDKRIFNVGKDLSNAGGNAADILGNLPSVNVDVDGTVSLRGSENVRILINGRPSGFVSRDPDGLRKLQGNRIERVEIITNPSSRYDAAGEVGIINIILKKNEEEGFNGSVMANAGYPTVYGAGFSLNLGKRKSNWFSSYGVDYRDRPGYGHSFQEFKSTDSTYRQKNDRNNEEVSHNLMLGLDYFFTDKATVTAQVEFDTGNGWTNTLTRYEDYKNDALVNTVIRTEREREDEQDLEGTFTFKREFDKKGQQFTADFKIIKEVDDETTSYTEGDAGSTPRIQNSINLARETNWIAQIDYVHPFSGEGKFETGLKTATRIIKNEFGLEEQNSDGSWTSFNAFTNNLVYTERVHAGYIMASNRFNKLSAQAGLRGELSDITTELLFTNEINPRTYFNIFPSSSLSYAIKENKTLQLSYSYRISRPDFRNLLPFDNFRDSRVFFVGNPNLRPEYTHSMEAGYLLDWESGSILTSFYHRYRKDVIQRIVTDVDEQGRTRIIPINMSVEKAYGFEFNLSLTVKNWWRVNSSANVYRALTSGEHEGEELSSDTYTLNTRTTSKITIADTWNIQTSFNYRAPRITTQGKELYQGSVDIGLSKDLFNGKATVTANVRDLFNMRKRRSIYDTDTYYSRSVFQWQPRQLMITLTYRINQEIKDDDNDDRGDDGGGGEDY